MAWTWHLLPCWPYLPQKLLDAFLGSIVFGVAETFVGVVTHTLGPFAGFLFCFEKRVDVGGDQLVEFPWELPDFVHVLDDATSVDVFLQFRGGPGTHEKALGLGVNATETAFGQPFRLFVFHTGSTKGKREFAATAID